MHKITSVGPISFAKIMAVTSILMALVVCIPWGLFMILIGLVGGASGEEAGLGIAFGGLGGGLLVMIGIPLMYGVVSFLVGLIYALILNLVLHLAGGLELTIESPAQAAGYGHYSSQASAPPQK